MSKIKKYFMFSCCFFAVFSLFVTSVNAEISHKVDVSNSIYNFTLSGGRWAGCVTDIRFVCKKEGTNTLKQFSYGFSNTTNNSTKGECEGMCVNSSHCYDSVSGSVDTKSNKKQLTDTGKYLCNIQYTASNNGSWEDDATKVKLYSEYGNVCGSTNYGSWTESKCEFDGFDWDEDKACCNGVKYIVKLVINTTSNYKCDETLVSYDGDETDGIKFEYNKTSTGCEVKVPYGEKIKIHGLPMTNFVGWDKDKNTTSPTFKQRNPGSTDWVLSTVVWQYETIYAFFDKDLPSGNTPEPTTTKILVTTKTPVTTKKTTTPVTKYNITIDANGGPGYDCPSNVKYSKPGVCSQDLSKGTTVVLPTVKNLKDDKYKFMGWNTSTDCNKSTMKQAGESVKVNSKVTYYACYQEYVRVNRYLMEGAVADGTATVPCGTNYYISYCTEEKVSDNKFEEYCYYRIGETNNYRKVYRNKLATSLQCKSSSTALPTDLGDRYVSVAGSNFKCGDKLYITTCNGTSDTSSCNYTKVNGVSASGTVLRGKLKAGTDLGKQYALAACDKEETEDNKKCSSMKIEYDNTSEGAYNLCYEKGTRSSEIREMLEKYYRCADGYTFDETYIKLEGKEDCNSYICNATYRVRCENSEGIKPIVDVTSGFVDSSNYGTISVNARAFNGEIDSYYVSEEKLAPTARNEWTRIDGNSFEIKSTPGTLYIWVRDSEGNISNPVTATVFDNNNTKNTVKKLELYDANGKIQTPSTLTYDSSNINSSKYVMMSNDLRKDSNVLADAFNPFNMEYELEVSSPTISVYATLTSTDSKYVSGYEPRTVNLNYGLNTVLIKIEDNEGKVRTYTILVTRVDDRTSDNTLSDIKLSVGNIEFNANVTDYKIEIPNNTTSVDVKSAIASSVASYVSGYEPGIVDITDDTTVKLIKVKSQTGSTRTYVLTFVKKGTDTISDESLQLKDLRIPNVYVPFESDVANYSFSVDYETDLIEINTMLLDENSRYVISVENVNKDKYTVGSNVGIALEPGENFIEIKVINKDGEESYYRFTIIRKEYGLGISDDKTLKELRVLGYDIDFKPERKEYTVRIKQEKSLVITAVPNSNRAEVFIRGNEELSGFSTVRIKVVAENGEYETYSIDIKKDPFNKAIEIASIIAGGVIILGTSAILVIKKKKRSKREYYSE